MARLLATAILLLLAFDLEAQPAGAVERLGQHYQVSPSDLPVPYATLAVAKDGSLLIADDVSQSIWRVSYPR